MKTLLKETFSDIKWIFLISQTAKTLLCIMIGEYLALNDYRYIWIAIIFAIIASGVSSWQAHKKT